MQKSHAGSRVVWLELVGFAIIIALSWANELAGLTRVLLGGHQQTDWREGVIETVVVVVVAVPVVVLTRADRVQTALSRGVPAHLRLVQDVESR
jgi:hypothetical protein